MSMAAAPEMALARSGGGGLHGGEGGGESFQGGARGHNGFRHSQHANNHSHERDRHTDGDHRPNGERSHAGDAFLHAPDGHDRQGWRGSDFDDHRPEGLFAGGWSLDSLFHPHRYGSGDFQYCMRRDIYGDLYQAC